MTAPAWTPNMPLRSDATDEQIFARWTWILNETSTHCTSVAVAREYAAACVEAASKCECGRGFHQLCPVCDNDE